MRVLIMSNGRQKKWTVLKSNCNQIYSRYGRMTTPLAHPSTDTIPRCGWCDQKLSDARETLLNLDLVEQVFKVNRGNSVAGVIPLHGILYG